MNDRYRELRKQYDDIDDQVWELHAKQRVIREQMKEACTHVNLDRLDPDPFLVDLDVEDDEVRYKCRDCFDYFSVEEVEKMRQN